jgi:hypothetical protein
VLRNTLTHRRRRMGSRQSGERLLTNHGRGGARVFLIDSNRELAEGEAMNLQHAAALSRPVRVCDGDYSDAADSSIAVIAAGVGSHPGKHASTCWPNLGVMMASRAPPFRMARTMTMSQMAMAFMNIAVTLK